MFRYEAPQLGRFRQFYQFGLEAFGMSGPDIDVEQILIAARIWKMLGLQDQITLQINSLGTSSSREKYREKLIEFFNENLDLLDEDSKRRLMTNPLRILDSKNPAMQLLLTAAPRMLDFLDEASRSHFNELRRLLDAAKISYVVNPRIVRGLDYYNMTVYEWVTDRLGAQGTVCAGGRYDGLVAHLGGQSTPAVGFAMGLERIISLLETVYTPNNNPDVYFILLGEGAVERGLLVSEMLHTVCPQLRILNDYTKGSSKRQFRRADNSGAKVAIIIGEDELKAGTVSLKHLRQDRPQTSIPQNELPNYLLQCLVE
jgi:histidyl-tRNA synthetase